jgi:Fe-S-cluster-containing dehydrogenase component/formate-dependent nitrite reductase membrane component NrfD
MKYGFVIDNRKCIGCHACTTACKSEHNVAIGVNRTWVKQVEKGTFPDTTRMFSVMRCNQCTDAPCVEICPTTALFIREDGIVDFNNDRCIGCKSCMQACPYDALYIDPKTQTAAKCNYCAHRIDVGLEPACVNVCPEHAIVSGDMDNPDSEISEVLGRHEVTVRKPEKDTKPNVFYINGDQASLNPSSTEPSYNYMWNSQSKGVGHYAKYAESKTKGVDLKGMLSDLNQKEEYAKSPDKSIDVLLQKNRRVYDSPSKGTLWGWEVSGYIFTKAIATGVFLVAFLASITNRVYLSETMPGLVAITSLIFLGITGLLLVKDLDQPKRFLYVLLRPQFKSWLVRGAYAITLMGAFISLWMVALWNGWEQVQEISFYLSAITAFITAIYTAFLFAQAKGRDFWQSPSLAVHMVLHSVMAGAAVSVLWGLTYEMSIDWEHFLRYIMMGTIGVNLFTLAIEMWISHPTKDSKTVVSMILRGEYQNRFWYGVIVFGNALPMVLIYMNELAPVSAVLILIGIYLTEHIWVQAPQKVTLV